MSLLAEATVVEHYTAAVNISVFQKSFYLIIKETCATRNEVGLQNVHLDMSPDNRH